ncbi:hypothetical protein [Thalassobacillus pellis]|uniref:hypothetical protein n=1 Tax=Thalassobacillus pellis TaxID=748008 RepID=UPI001960673E|nr:hypothetical protein [Thalassobacillus pellis]MBM7551206.1 uncharacterized membrane protein YccF (DUF307 family) [Thalassobacillus pellis]
MKHILCHYCKKEIKDRDELVTASNWFRLRPFHYVCFQKKESETSLSIKSWKPVNGTTGNISAALMLLLALWMLFTDSLGAVGDLIGIIAIYPVGLRLLSLMFIELTLPKISPDKTR